LLMDQPSSNNSRRRVLQQMTRHLLRRRLRHLHHVLPLHPPPTLVLLHQTQGMEGTPLSQSAQRARKARNHEWWCQMVSVPAAHWPRSRVAPRAELTHSQDAGAAPGPRPSLLAHRRVRPLQNSGTNARQTMWKRSHRRHPQVLRVLVARASQNRRNGGRR